MKSQQIAAVAAFFSVVSAMPVGDEQPLENLAFSLPQVAVPVIRAPPAAAYAKALAKYGAPVPAHVAAAAAVQSGAVTTNPTQYDSEYLTQISVGSPAQNLMMDFDTGSADLWVFSTEMPASESSGHALYTPSKSTTSKQLSGYTWDISYGDGSGARGNVFDDKVVIGSVTATTQAVEAATSVSSEFVQDTSDGLVGLAFSSINTVSPNKQNTFFATVMSSLASPVFCAYLKHAAAGVYDFGFIDSSKYTGSIAYTPVNTANGFWEVTANTAYVGGTSIGTFGDAIADTGTTLILAPDAIISKYYAKVSGATNSNAAGGYIFPCSATLPTFGVAIGGATHTVPGSYMNYAPYSGSQCYGGLQSSSGIGFNILGDVFLKSQYVIFDGGNTRLGIATQA